MWFEFEADSFSYLSHILCVCVYYPAGYLVPSICECMTYYIFIFIRRSKYNMLWIFTWLCLCGVSVLRAVKKRTEDGISLLQMDRWLSSCFASHMYSYPFPFYSQGHIHHTYFQFSRKFELIVKSHGIWCREHIYGRIPLQAQCDENNENSSLLTDWQHSADKLCTIYWL